MKQFISTWQTLLRNQLRNLDNFKEPLLDSLKQGLVVFVAFLLMLFILNYITSIVQVRSITLLMLNKLDIATALVGFALVFGWKFLEGSYSNR